MSRVGIGSITSVSTVHPDGLDAVAHFELTCGAHQAPDTHAEAEKELETLYASSQAIPLARAVLERSTSGLAQEFAAHMIRRAALRLWPTTSADDRTEVRDWLLGLAAGRCEQLPSVLVQQLLVGVAVMWKRGWLEESGESRGRFFSHIQQLFETSSLVHMTLGANLVLTLVQEMSVDSGGCKSTALGLPREFHVQTASEFQKEGLRECFVLTFKLLLGKMQEAMASPGGGGSSTSSSNTTTTTTTTSSSSSNLIGAGGASSSSSLATSTNQQQQQDISIFISPKLTQSLLETVIAVLSWDFVGLANISSRYLTSSSASSGSGRHSSDGGGALTTSARSSPGASWRELLADPERTLVTAMISLYANTRTQRPGDLSVSHLGRQVLTRLCGLEGDVFESHQSMAMHGTALIGGISELLGSPLYNHLNDMLTRDRANAGPTLFVDEEEYRNAADAEAVDLCGALAIAVRTYKLERVVRLGAHVGGAEAVGGMLAVTSALAGNLLDEFHDAAAQVLSALDGSADKGKVQATKKALKRLLAGDRYTSALSVVDAVLEVWSVVIAELEPVAILAAGARDPSSQAEVDAATALAPLLETAQAHASAFYERIVRTRLSMGAAIMRCGINDDEDEHEDKSLLRDQMEYVAVLGRFVPVHAMQLLTALLPPAYGRLKALWEGNGSEEDEQSSPHNSSRGGGGAGGGGGLFLSAGSSRGLSTGGSSSGGGGVDIETKYAQAHEECWWLLGFTGYLLADAANAEDPEIPVMLNVLSREAGREVGAVSILLAAAASTSGAGSSHNNTGGSADEFLRSGWRPDVAASVDPIVALSSAALTLVQFEMYRMLSDTSGRMDNQSPLQAAQIAWFLGRWTRTYLMPKSSEDGRDRGVGRSRTITTAYGADATVFASALGGSGNIHNNNYNNTTATTNQVLYTLPVEAGTLGGRAVLELVLQAASVFLCVWGARGSDADVATAALGLLRDIISSDQAARFAVCSPAWATLAEAGSLMISGQDLQSHTPTSAASATSGLVVSTSAVSQDGGDAWKNCFSVLSQLAPEAQGKLLGILLSITTAIGAESPGHRIAEQSLGDEVILGEAAAANADVAHVVARWQAYYSQFTNAASEQLSGVLGSAEFSTSSSDARVEREIVRLLCIHNGLLTTRCAALEAWHLPATAACLACTSTLIETYHAAGPVCMESLRFILDFLDVQAAVLSEAEQNAAMYGAIANVFQAYAKHHTGVLKPVVSGSGSGAGSSSSSGISNNVGAGGGMSLASHVLLQQSTYYSELLKETEEETVVDILMLLRILENIADREDALDSLNITPADGTDVAAGQSPASGAMMMGLAYLVPLLSSSIMDRPGLVSAYMSIVTHVMTSHPATVVRMDPGLFGIFAQNLEDAVGSWDVNVVSSAIDAISTMGMYHCGAKKAGGNYGALDLGPQLLAVPDLFSKFARALLQLSLGASGPNPNHIGRIGNALFVCILCDPEGYQGLLSSFLAGQEDEQLTARLTHEFNTLNEAFMNAVNEQKVAQEQALAQAAARSSSRLTGSGGGGAATLGAGAQQVASAAARKRGRESFAKPFQHFVQQVRGSTSMF